MLIIPISDKIGLKDPPVITILLVVINCLIFFLFQLNDNNARAEAELFYLKSGLADIETPYYRDYLEATEKRPGLYIPEEKKLHDEIVMSLHFELENDFFFLERLNNDQVIRPSDPGYTRWKSLRQEYEKKRARSIAFSHGIRPAFPEPSDFLSYMFLHGGFGHLLGNMVFLWILGSLIELGARRLFFTAIYLVSGLMAGLVFWGVYPLSTIPLVGASGAIAGLMGAYTVLYGNKKVSVFYSLGFYFNTGHISAIVLFPLWLLNEFYQLTTGESHVAYMAHIGGLVTGAAIAAVGKRIKGQVAEERFEESVENKILPMLAQALEHMGDLNMKPAKEILRQVLDLSPEHPDALFHLFNIHKLSPESDAFHDITRRLLTVYLKNQETHPAAITVFKTYVSLVSHPSLPIPLYLQIANAMIAAEDLDSAEKILTPLLDKKQDAPGLPSILVKLARAFHQKGQTDKWNHYHELIRSCFPDSVEASILLHSEDTPSA